MNKFGKTVLALALTATIGFSGQAFAETSGTTTTTGTTGTAGTATTTGTTGTTASGTTGNYGTYGTGTYSTTGTGTYGATTSGTTGSTVRNYNDNMLDRMNTYTNVTDRTGYGYGGNYHTTAYRTNTATTGSNWGWLGLIGLLGLAGMRGRGRDEREVR